MSGNNVIKATEKLKDVFYELDFNCVDYLSIHLYFNPNRSTPITMSDIASYPELISALPETVNAIWSVNHDEKLNGNEIRLSAILAGKKVWKYQAI